MKTFKHFDWAVKENPDAALQYAADRLTDEQFADAVEKAPEAALKFAQARMSPEQFAKAAKGSLRAALQFAADRLTPEQRLREPFDSYDIPNEPSNHGRGPLLRPSGHRVVRVGRPNLSTGGPLTLPLLPQLRLRVG